MKIIRWSAVVATALFVLMNLGATGDPDLATWLRIGGGVLAVAGAVAAFGLATGRNWGGLTVVGVGALNVAAAIGAVIDGHSGASVGIVVGGLAVVLGAMSGQSESAHAHA